MSSLPPRIVLVHRASAYDTLIARHGTRGQAGFFLQSRGQNIADVEAQHMALRDAMAETKRAIPRDWSIAEVERADLDRFLFSDSDIIVAVGQDGLVANLAKYTSGQPVVGVAATSSSEGILARAQPREVGALLDRIQSGNAAIETRTMVAAKLGNGDRLLALNEVFVGHRTHQSARYLLRDGDQEEFQSSSGVIIATGTGATGWAKSILTATHQTLDLAPSDPCAAYFAREPWPSRTSGCSLAFGRIEHGQTLQLTSRIDAGGVIFADGIEQDFLSFDWGQTVQITVAPETLKLVTP